MNIGRDALCTCGSGKKYKHCHGSIAAQPANSQESADEWMQQMLARHEAENQQREHQQGLGRPIISFETNRDRIVAVGARAFYSQNWKTFHDFLRDYPVLLFGEPWLSKQNRRPPDDQHPYLRWLRRAIDDHNRLATKALGPIATGPATAAISSVMSFAYNLYLLHHNLPTDNQTEQLCKKLVKRLRMSEHFFGALYETYALALFAVAGFAIELEDESNRSVSHCEFIARGKSGRQYSIECKSRNRESISIDIGDAAQLDGEVRRLFRKLKDALSKEAAHDRVVFLDLDLPTVTQPNQFDAVASVIIPKLRELELTLQIDGQPAPPAYVFITNIPDHRNDGDDSRGLMVFGTGFKIPDFGHNVVHAGMHELIKSRDRHADVLSLLEAARVRHVIPSTFDGSNPALAFSSDSIPRLRVGEWYMIPIEHGVQVEGQLCSGIVMDAQKLAYCNYKTKDGRYIVATNALTDDELHAYRLHPSTFFGSVDRNVRPKVETAVDWFDFYFESYQHASREKLLEFLSGAHDFEELVKQSQRDLAITYCERLAASVLAQKQDGT